MGHWVLLGGQGSSTPWAVERSEAQHRPCLSSQEIGNKKQKKAALSEEDDSGVEVYYREGEEAEEMSMLTKVRGGGVGEEGCSGRRVPGLPPEDWAVISTPFLSSFAVK